MSTPSKEEAIDLLFRSVQRVFDVSCTDKRGDFIVDSAHMDDMMACLRVAKEVMAGRFPSVSCSQCGCEFGPGDHGFSHCDSHKGMVAR